MGGEPLPPRPRPTWADSKMANYQTESFLCDPAPQPVNDFYPRTTCRLCDSTLLSPALTLQPTPPANSFLAEIPAEPETRYPLDVRFCEQCKHLQLVGIVNPEILFRNYVYVSSTSPVMVNHLLQYSKEAIEKQSLDAGDFVVEFGSNDGCLLQHFKDQGMLVLGVDPARNLAAQATASGILTIPEFFNQETAELIQAEHGQPMLICANHCCAHIDDLPSVIRGVKALLHADGLFVMEVGYLLEVYNGNLFDTIYHEHCDFHRVAPLVRFFQRYGLHIFDCKVVNIQGGSLRVFVGHKDRTEVPGGNLRVQEHLRLESSAGLNELHTFKSWDQKIKKTGHELMSMIAGLRAAGHTIAAYGAPAKATTLMLMFGFEEGTIDYIVDDNPFKQGLYSPGLHIPVVPFERLFQAKPDYVLVLAWNFANAIIEKHKNLLSLGTRFIVPLPDVRVVSALNFSK